MDALFPAVRSGVVGLPCTLERRALVFALGEWNTSKPESSVDVRRLCRKPPRVALCGSTAARFTRSCSSCAATMEEEAFLETSTDSSEEKDSRSELEEEEQLEHERWRAELLGEASCRIASFRLIHVPSTIPARHTAARRNVKSASSCTAIASSPWATAALCCMHDAGRCAPTASGSERGMASSWWRSLNPRKKQWNIKNTPWKKGQLPVEIETPCCVLLIAPGVNEIVL